MREKDVDRGGQGEEKVGRKGKFFVSYERVKGGRKKTMRKGEERRTMGS